MMFRWWLWEAVAILLVGATLVDARTMTVKDRARLRQGPAATSPLVRELAPGTKLEILGESAGWNEVRTADGQRGYVWAGWLTEGEAVPKPPEGARLPDASQARSLANEVHDLGQVIATLVARPQPVTGEEIERLRAEVERVATGEQDLRRLLDERAPSQSSTDPPADGSLTLTPGLLLLGGVLGWVASRLFQRRRDRHQRYRLRL